MVLVIFRFIATILVWLTARHLPMTTAGFNGVRLARGPYWHLRSYLSYSSHGLATLAYWGLPAYKAETSCHCSSVSSLLTSTRINNSSPWFETP